MRSALQERFTSTLPESGAFSAERWVVSTPTMQGDRRPAEILGASKASACVSDVASSPLVVFDGSLYNRRELAEQLGTHGAMLNNAGLLRLAYERWKLDLPQHIRGIFALLIFDAKEHQILAVRDPLGAYPLFYAEGSGRLWFSTSIDALREQPGVGRGVNRAALADHLCHRWPDQHETFFAAIRRVPPGYMLHSSGKAMSITRYWEPIPGDRDVEWLTEEELQQQFDATFERAVERTFEHGATGLFLSGGLDSISVGAMATDVARQRGSAPPVALSLGFPGDAGEEMEQRGVASSLGLVHEFVPFYDAVPTAKLLTAALDISRTRPAPLLNTWLPAYADLARRGKKRGVKTILSGAGGDEWLGVTPHLTADLLRDGEVRQLVQFVAGWRRSYDMSLANVLRCLVVKFGLRPLASSALDRLAPGVWKANRIRRSVKSIFPWVAPDATLRAEQTDRIERWLPSVTPSKGFYLEDVRNSLEHTLTSLELEEIFETGRSLDVHFLHPFWNAEVVDILYRTPPLLLFSGGRSKSIVRETMKRRFPGLGLDRQKKRAGTKFYSSVLDREIPDLWRSHRDLTALSDLGIVDRSAAIEMAERSLASKSGPGFVRIWDLINLDTWVAAHQ